MRGGGHHDEVVVTHRVDERVVELGFGHARPRIVAAEGRDERDDHVDEGGAGRGQAELGEPAGGEDPHRRGGGPVLLQQLLGDLSKGRAGGGQDQTARGTVEQFETALAFQPLQLPAQRRLHDAQHAGGLGDRADLGHGSEGAQQAGVEESVGGYRAAHAGQA